MDGDAISIDSSATGSYNAYFAIDSDQGLDALYAIGNDAWDIHYMGITWLCYLSSDNSNSIAIGVPLDYLREEGDTLIDSYDAVDTFGEVIEYADSFGGAGDAVLDSSFANCDQLDLAEQMQFAAQHDQLIGFCVRGSYDDIAPFIDSFTLVQLDPAI